MCAIRARNNVPRCARSKQLLWLIGPPLQSSFETLLDGSGLNASEAIKICRKRFGTVGLFENRVYHGAPELLAEQTNANKRLFIVSTKSHDYTNRALRHFEISDFF